MANKPYDLSWQKDGACAKPENKHLVDAFFSDDRSEQHKAKNLCFTCPVRKDCIKFALETKEIWGVWGGKDEDEIRRTLSVNIDGVEYRRYRYPQCGYCSARTSKLITKIINLEGGGRWTTARVVECTECGFSWRSRTSANAVNAYHADKTERRGRKRRTR